MSFFFACALWTIRIAAALYCGLMPATAAFRVLGRDERAALSALGVHVLFVACDLSPWRPAREFAAWLYLAGVAYWIFTITGGGKRLRRKASRLLSSALTAVQAAAWRRESASARA